MCALGLLRTYYYLIQHKSDFYIACNETWLLPPNILWTEFCRFSQCFPSISDEAVSERYHYGELRLTRLSLYAKLVLRKFQYERIHGQFGAFFARFYGHLLFVFGILSIVLNAIQVELSVETLLINTRWQVFWYTCRWFVIVTLVCMGILVLALTLLFIGMIVDEWVFALKKRYKGRHSRRRQYNGV